MGFCSIQYLHEGVELVKACIVHVSENDFVFPNVATERQRQSFSVNEGGSLTNLSGLST